MKTVLRAIAVLALAGLCTCATRPDPVPGGLKVERVVMLMRHGIRPPTKALVTPPGVASEDWPDWSTPWGELTSHGYQAIVRLAGYDRAVWTKDGMLPADHCPGAGEVVVWSDSDQRTIRTGDAMVEGLFNGCNIVNGHLPQGQTDRLFSPLGDANAMDAAAALAAVTAEVGPVMAVQRAHGKEWDALQRVLGCCAPPICAEAGLAAGCRLADLPSTLVFDAGDSRPKLTGPLGYGPTAAQVLMLEYVEGRPMNEVGWGRAGPADIETIMTIHSLKGDLVQHPFFVGARGASPLARRMLAALESGEANAARLTILVGHDTNIVDLSGLLRFNWKMDSYPANNPPPGGGVGFELLRSPDGRRFVRTFYRAQTMDQMRNLTALGLETPASRQVLKIPGCSYGDDDTICTLDVFAALVRSKLINE
jgi:4-phytase/acid phosphatase